MSNNDDIFFTSAEAMRILKLKRSTFYRYVQQGVIPAVRIGSFIRIPKGYVFNLAAQWEKASA